MIGQLVPTWRETWKHVWAKLLQGADEPDQLTVDLFRELAAPPAPPPEPPQPPEDAFDENGTLIDAEALARAEGYQTALLEYERRRARHEEALNGVGTRKALHSLILASAATEQSAIQCLERGFSLAEEFGGDALANRFYLLVEAFLQKFSLRYDLRRPFTLHPTLSGVFASMMLELKTVAQNDADLQPSFHEFEEALRDITAEQSERLIKTCIQKQMNFLEALGQKNPGVTTNTLGRICNQIGVWPHEQVKEAIKNLYGFACDYPGIRHAGTAANRLRAIEMKDMVAMSVLLVGFTPYLSHQLDAEEIYRR